MMRNTLFIILICVFAIIVGTFSVQAARVSSALNAPSNLVATAVSTSQINLSWQDNSDNESGFAIEERVSGGSFVEIVRIGQNATIYQRTGLFSATEYSYRVRAFRTLPNKIVYSGYSNIASATTFAETVPFAPSNLIAGGYASGSFSFIDVSWQDNANNEDGFKLERSLGDTSNFTQVAILGINNQFYRDANVVSGNTYYYRVRAFNEVGNSDYSNMDSAVAP